MLLEGYKLGDFVINYNFIIYEMFRDRLIIIKSSEITFIVFIVKVDKIL